MSKDLTIDFIGVGFSRCGTTWIAKCLQAHPEICTPEWKETHFFDFDHNYKKGLNFYKSFFKNSDNKVVGEYCPEYIFEEKALQRIKKDFPNVKIIVSLRHPIDRTFSHYLYSKRKKGIPKEFCELFNKDFDDIIDKSNYYKYITTLYKYFVPKNIYILIYDDYKKNPKKFIQSIYNFLEVDDSFIPDSLLIETNKSKNLQYKFSFFEHLFAGRLHREKYFYWRILISILKFLNIGVFINYLRGLNKVKNIKEETEIIFSKDKKRLKEFYVDGIERLEKLIKRDLIIWK